jgi:predicted phage terminase large subunit-like protein
MEEDIIVSPEEAANEILFRRAARQHLIPFTKYTKPTYVADPAHELIARELEAVERGETKRLMLFAPPRIGKSELSTRRFPAFYLGRNPQKNVISASYNADFGATFGREVRTIVRSEEYLRLFPEIAIRSDNRAANEWELEQGGKYFGVGVGSGTTGKGADLFMIDDPIKDRKEADSPTTREDQWNWYRDVVYTRLEEDGAIILTLTRWHHDDIAGRIIELMDDGKGVPWKILSLPALPKVRRTEDGQMILNDDGSVPGDPLGRKPDEPLAPNRFSYAALIDRQQVLGERSWAALYQQEPMSEEGGMFKGGWFQVIPASELPARRTRVRAWDLAASENGDWTVGVLMSKDTDGVYYIENVIRFRGGPMAVEKKIIDTARDDGKSVEIILPQDPGQAGVSQKNSYIRKLAGYRVKAVRPTGPKATRAAPFGSQVEGRNVRLVQGSWNDAFTEELETFPLGTHDDQVDAAADAFNALLGSKKPRILNW